jgi:hypothetical protein
MRSFISRRVASDLVLSARRKAAQSELSLRFRRSYTGFAFSRRWNSTLFLVDEIHAFPRTSTVVRPFLQSSRRYLSNDSDNNKNSHSYWKNLSKRDMADLEDFLSRRIAAQVQDPVLDKDLASLQWIHPRVAVSEDGTLQVLLKLPSLLHPKLDTLKEAVRRTSEREFHRWASEKVGDSITPPRVNVEAIATKTVPMMARLVDDHEELLKNLGPGLASVSHFVAVYSCKGGVGKSTVAVNLAYELAHRGGRVGLVDLDIYGPSLQVLVRPDDAAVRSSPIGPGMVYPIRHKGVQLLSLGFVSVKVRA